MNYPFMYKVVGKIDVDALRASLVQVAPESWPFNIKDWSLTMVKSEYLENYIKEKHSAFVLYGGHAVLSKATSCVFHNDLGTEKDLIYSVTHRMIVCLSENYFYEWDSNGEITVFRPQIGDVIAFNNCEMHRFEKDKDGPAIRETLTFNLVDKNLLPLIKGMI